MSFFRNIRSSITRSKSSSRDTTPVKTISMNSSRPSSIMSSEDRRRDSMDSHADSMLNRGETFILGSSDQEDKSNSNSSTLEKKSKKSKVLSKFSTFTKRKKTPQQDGSTYEHHPSDNATNTYYKWNSDGSSSNVDYDAQSDPFNFLYEKHSTLKLLQNGAETTDNRCGSAGVSVGVGVGGVGSGSGGGIGVGVGVGVGGATKNHNLFDSSTYRKGKATTQLKSQLEQLKTLHNTKPDLCEEDQDTTDPDKYKTVTLNSFRKSFRDKFLQQQQKNAEYNPSWFIEVEPTQKSEKEKELHDSKENRPDCLVFDNENYRPGSRSPVRDRNNINARPSRSITRSPVKRNETFRIERSEKDETPLAINLENNPSIRVEIKNSVMPPHVPGRIVPIGVAKPMLSTQPSNSYFRTQVTPSSSHIGTTYQNASARIKAVSPQRSPYKSTTINQNVRPGRYQTLIQISNDNNNNDNNNNTTAAASKLATTSIPFNRQNRSMSTRIQLLGGSNQQTSPQKFNNNIGSRYSYVGPIQTTTPIGLSSYELLRNSENTIKPQFNKIKHTYFGGDVNANTKASSALPPTRLLLSPSNTNRLTSRTINNQTNFESSQLANSANKLRHPMRLPKQSPTTMTITTSTLPQPSSPATSNYMNRRDQQHQQQTRHVMPMQRRSRSPIKMPWR